MHKQLSNLLIDPQLLLLVIFQLSSLLHCLMSCAWINQLYWLDSLEAICVCVCVCMCVFFSLLQTSTRAVDYYCSDLQTPITQHCFLGASGFLHHSDKLSLSVREYIAGKSFCSYPVFFFQPTWVPNQTITIARLFMFCINTIISNLSAMVQPQKSPGTHHLHTWCILKWPKTGFIDDLNFDMYNYCSLHVIILWYEGWNYLYHLYTVGGSTLLRVRIVQWINTKLQGDSSWD